MSRSTRPRMSGTAEPSPLSENTGSVDDALRQTWVLRFAAILALALIPQAIASYFHFSWVTESGFFYGTFLSRVLGLIAAALLLRIPPAAFGLGRPVVGKRELRIGAVLLAAGTAIAIGLLQMDSYQSAYEEVRAGSAGDRFARWALFTVSTTLSWEWLHRGLLLFGIRHVLREQAATRGAADAMAIGVTAVFEVLFHFRKPPLESVAMMIGSPVLSWIGLRQGSLWVPLLLHLWVETLFFAFVWL